MMMASAGNEWRLHWRPLLASSVGVATGFSMLQFTTSLFIQPWQAEFGWSRGQIAAAHNGMILTALLSPFAGALLDRVGVRRPLLIAICITAAAYLAMTGLTGSLTQFYATYLLLQVAGIFTTGLVFTRVVAARFIRSRGLALACTRIGISLLGMVLPALLHGLIASEGWRAGFLLLAAIMLLIGLPVCFFGIADTAPAVEEEHPAQRAPSFLALVAGNRRVVILCLAAACAYAPLGALLSQFQPLLTERGIAAGDAASLIGLLAGSVLVGTLLSGVLVDRIWAPMIACLFSIGPLIGCLILMQPVVSLPMAATAAVLIGMAQGAEIDIVAYLSARYFGMRHYSTIYGSTIMAMALMSVVGQVGIGYLYDRTGGYNAALLPIMAVLLASAVCYLSLGRYPKPDPARL
ncbi:MFS transporter [Sphingobium sp. HBC34]|uniref:MFS transporter n=1 Tax=Sphingobium cyanobacteriorum TaxID=3063954 RepID=A0ABT8ZMS3_9SPHN|nr:MFS transporter [Sphingobium sp. HBC34]MDO7834806.1 MFS transporter [Sphingobium sp. HBC34]